MAISTFEIKIWGQNCVPKRTVFANPVTYSLNKGLELHNNKINILKNYTGRKATYPESVFTKDMQRTGQISYTCLLPVLIRIVENFLDMS